MPYTKDMLGKCFGSLEVIGRTQERQDGYCVWQCRCDCGNEIFVNTKRLLRGTVKDCGCVPKKDARRGAIAEDLTGHRFGEWEVKRREKNKNGRVMWECQCSCGTRRIISAQELKAGKTNSCRNPVHTNLYNRKNLEGSRFGRLKVLWATEKRDARGNVYWLCRCDCGKEVQVSGDALVQKRCKSCGCLKSEVQQNIPNTLHWVQGTCVEMLEKRKYRKDNTSGFRGVYESKNHKFRVSIGFKGKRFHVGTFNDYEDAVNARLEVEQLIHDRFVQAYTAWSERASKNPEWAKTNELHFEVDKVDGQFQVTTNMEENRKSESLD